MPTPPFSRPVSRRIRWLVPLALVAVVAGACTRSGDRTANPSARASTTTAPTEPPTTVTTEASTTTTTTTTTAPPPATTAPPPPPPPAGPTGTLAWARCGALQCATLTVPMDYTDPGGPTIDLALSRQPATSPAQRIGSLLFNPGGPGNSGVDALPRQLQVLTPALKARFDIVSWDPRGVGRSAPVRCREAGSPPSSGRSGPPPDPAPTRPEDQQALVEGYRAFGQVCAAHSGPVLAHVGTDSTVEDLERIRIALGEERLSFIGHSAGTLIGAVYADRYPHRVRAMVLDGPVDPSLDLHGKTMAQARAYEQTLDAFFAWCTATASCAWKPPGPPRDALLGLIDRVRQEPLHASNGEQIGVGELNNAMMGRLNARSRWASLAEALAAAERGDGNPFSRLSSGYVHSGASNAADARISILCLDHPSLKDPDGYPALADAARAEAPVFGPVLTWAELPCGVWPHPPTLEARPVRAAGAPPILVVATTGDPATPQAWGEAVAGQLEGGVLVLRHGQEHVAYYYSSCVRRLVDAYLIDGHPPAHPTTCRS